MIWVNVDCGMRCAWAISQRWTGLSSDCRCARSIRAKHAYSALAETFKLSPLEVAQACRFARQSVRNIEGRRSKPLAVTAFSPDLFARRRAKRLVRRGLDHALKRGGCKRSHQLFVGQAINCRPAFSLIGMRPEERRANQDA